MDNPLNNDPQALPTGVLKQPGRFYDQRLSKSSIVEAMERGDGFDGQRLRIISGPLQESYLQSPPTCALLVTDCGFFPHAQDHYRHRTVGIPQTIFISCVSGQGWVEIEGVTRDLKAGQVLTIPSGIPHRYGAHPKDPWSIWWMHAAGSSIPGLIEAAGITAKRPVVRPRDPLRLTQLFEEILTSMEKGESPSSVVGASGAAWHALSLLADHYLGSSTESDPIERATVYLNSQITRTVRVADVARVVGLSTSHLSALFKQVHGVGILEYQLRQRMGLARDLLDSTELSIAEVASRCGFSDAFYFSRRFRSHHSMSPSAYRLAPKG